MEADRRDSVLLLPLRVLTVIKIRSINSRYLKAMSVVQLRLHCRLERLGSSMEFTLTWMAAFRQRAETARAFLKQTAASFQLLVCIYTIA